jgi:small subunit ribosomal protein S20
MRNSARKQLRNRSVKSRLKTFEKRYTVALKTGKKDEAGTALRAAISAFDKAVKFGVIPRGTANRKKSRLTLRLATLK